ncbi:hypothetical protein [Psychrobacillus sp. FSL H8-0510]|uniref:hypothetical protein n=1 Tax=Psychrobacillus sp. FSL H8-0510 TaxID=2921394 RepID=UPI0030FC99B6
MKNKILDYVNELNPNLVMVLVFITLVSFCYLVIRVVIILADKTYTKNSTKSTQFTTALALAGFLSGLAVCWYAWELDNGKNTSTFVLTIGSILASFFIGFFVQLLTNLDKDIADKHENKIKNETIIRSNNEIVPKNNDTPLANNDLKIIKEDVKKVIKQNSEISNKSTLIGVGILLSFVILDRISKDKK